MSKRLHAHATPGTGVHAPRPTARRAAWLALGLFAIAFDWGPLALLVACTFWILPAPLFTGGLAWLGHVAVDRAAGFGLRGPQGFQRG